MIIGITGKAGSGKDTAAGFIKECWAAECMAFADPMKRACADWFGWDKERLWGPSEAREIPDADGLTPRRALQLLGTEFGRACRPNVWVDIGLREAKCMLEHPGSRYSKRYGATYLYTVAGDENHPDCKRMLDFVVVTDVRFENEAKAIKEVGGIVVQIIRPEAGLKGAAALHASEQGIPETYLDAIVQNGGTLDEFRQDVLNVVEMVTGKNRPTP